MNKMVRSRRAHPRRRERGPVGSLAQVVLHIASLLHCSTTPSTFRKLPTPVRHVRRLLQLSLHNDSFGALTPTQAKHASLSCRPILRLAGTPKEKLGHPNSDASTGPFLVNCLDGSGRSAGWLAGYSDRSLERVAQLDYPRYEYIQSGIVCDRESNFADCSLVACVESCVVRSRGERANEKRGIGSTIEVAAEKHHAFDNWAELRGTGRIGRAGFRIACCCVRPAALFELIDCVYVGPALEVSFE